MKRRFQTAAAVALLVPAAVVGVSQHSCASKPTSPRVAETNPPASRPDVAPVPLDFMEVGERELQELESELGLPELEPSELDVPLTRRALHYVRFYSEDERGRRWFSGLYRRSGPYRDIVEQALREANLPLELLWLVGAESSFDTEATSSAHAVGLWQLIPAVGRARGLRVDEWVDERRSPQHCTRAAVEHLQNLFEHFGSADLVLAAYNAGTSRVEKAVEELRKRRRERGEAPQRIGFRHLAAEGLLPRETAEYVPRITAMAIMGANIKRLGFGLVKPDPEVRTTPIMVEAETRLSTVARAAGITVGELRKLNPELLMHTLPPGDPRAVLVPAHRYSRAVAVLPVFADEDAAAGDALPTDKPAEGTAPTEPNPVAPAQPPTSAPAAVAAADYDLVKTKMELARLLIGAPSMTHTSLFGNFSRLSLAPASDQPFTTKKVMWVGSDKPSVHVAVEAGLEKKVTALLAPVAVEEAIGHGITLRLEKDATATRVQIRVQFQGGGPIEADAPLSTAMVHQTQSEVSFVDVVRPNELDVGLLLAAGRLALLYDQARLRPAAALRSRLVRHRRLALEKTMNGGAWLALGDLVFHPRHPAFGRILDPRGPDAQAVRDRALVGEMPSMRMPGRATVTISGNFDPETARQGATFAISSVGLGMKGRERGLSAVKGKPDDQRIELESPHDDPLLLVGHALPGPEAVGHAASLVVLEILGGKKKSRLVRELGKAKLSRAVSTHVDPDATLTVGTIAVAPIDPSTMPQIEQHLDEALASLADKGPTRVELAYAKAILAIRLEKRLARVRAESGKLIPGKSFTSGSRMMEALNPGYHERLIQRIKAVDSKAVKRAIASHYKKAERYVVVQRSGHLDGTIAVAD